MAKYLILDLILAAIVALCAWRGFRTGIINGICGIIAVLIAIYGANLLSTTYSGEFIEVIEPFAGGVIDGMISDTLGYSSDKSQTVDLTAADGNEEDGKGGLFYVEELPEEDKTDVSKIAFTVYRGLGITEKAAQDLADEAKTKSPEVGVDMNETISHILCERIMYIMFFAIGFLLIIIVFSVIGNVLDLAFGLPGLENLNHIAGGLLGAVKGIVIIMVIACLCRYAGIILKDDMLSATWITEKLVRSNLIANILGI